ncbi:MAG TPA: ATP-binding protein [Candidatus Polarisedimenticolaceae bacterium]|nr:ATP-binding protein [Candidatus Polarisedimenticolaceae bacterium]
MSTLILLCGRPFSGKSSLAARLAADRGAAGISFDAINLERGLHGGDGLAVAEWASTLEIAKACTSAALKGRDLVVVDDTLCFRWMRDAFRELARAAGARVVLLYLDPPEPVLQQRMAENARTGRRRGIAPSVLAEHLSSFEAPEPEEAAVVLRCPDDVEAWLTREIETGPR